MEKEENIRQYYRALYRAWGAQHWWPAETRFEVIVGAYLTQNTAWKNVELALANLREANVLSVEAVRGVPIRKLERLIRPSGYFRQKAQRLKTFVAFLDREYSGSLDRLFEQPTGQLREQLLSLNGIGPETAERSASIQKTTPGSSSLSIVSTSRATPTAETFSRSAT